MKKRVNGAWVEKSPLKYGTATDTLTSFPAEVIADGTNASVDIIGNMAQNGTPSPSNIIYPSECGERTGNVCNPIPYKTDYYINASGVETPYNGIDIYKVSASAETTYTLSINIGLIGTRVRIHAYNNGSWVEEISEPIISALPETFVTPQNCDEIRFSITHDALNHIMLNLGSTALPYEPYGYKIPILLNSQTINKYLGEVQSTRNLKKYEFTGNENWVLSSSGYFYSANAISDYNNRLFAITTICTHYKSVTNATNGRSLNDGEMCLYSSSSGSTHEVYVKDDSYLTADDFKTYLQQQYANGTPVCVWYVLATPTTAIVNEPLRKIGTYADSISGITIPTVEGSQTFDVETTLKPSEVDLTYHGWHRTEPKERVNGDWE